MKRKGILTSILIFTLIFNILSQDNLSLKLITVTLNPLSKRNDMILVNKLDKAGNFTLEPGVLASYENFSGDLIFSVKALQGVYFDACSKLSGFTHIELKYELFRIWKNSVNIGAGPSFHYRKTWADIDGYVDENIYTASGDWQYKIIWLSGELEYNFYLSKLGDFTCSLNFIHPRSISFAIGYKLWLSRKKRSKGCNC